MINEISAGIVIFRESKTGEREYLLLHYPGGHFDLAKGHLENNETEKEAAVRELFEETGIKDFTLIDGFSEKISYFMKVKGETRSKDVTFFLAKTEQEKITISHEHKGFLWLPFKEAHEKITFDTAKSVVEKAEEFLQKLSAK